MQIVRQTVSRLETGVDTAGREPADMLPVVVNLDDADSPYDAVDALMLAAFTVGEQPWARTARLDRTKPDASLLPAGAHVIRTAVENTRDSRLAIGDGWTLRAVRWRTGGAEVTVTAVSDELARTVLEHATRDAVPPEPADDAVTIGFWYHSARRGPYRTTRPVTSTPWAGIRRNYASVAAHAFDRLMGVTRDSLPGRLVLLHGPPGTGKTTALRTLAYEWREWCEVDCVLDPEVLFSDPGYLIEVALGCQDDDENHDAEGHGGKRRWRLLILEDCDELIRGDAKQSSGQALSRLLNLTDGLLGQGRHVLVAVTTNEDLKRLHPAVVRPGRCLAQIEVGPLSRQEAVAWLGGPAPIDSAVTLAELIALRSGSGPVETQQQPDPTTGLYL
jgi:hypothetical protein